MRYEAQDQVFVAMPFSKPFQTAYETVIEPAIRRVTVNGRALAPRIINRATSGSPDIHEQIFDAILHSRLVVADLTVQANHKSDSGAMRWQANANVAYEVGLACGWRNPEDILLIHQEHTDHQYSFDVQNLRHVKYSLTAASVQELSQEFVRALNQSSFLAKKSFQKIIESVSPSTLQFLHQEVRRAFPVIAFNDTNMPMMDSRIHAASELLSIGALKNRNVIPQGPGKGVAIIYEWTELGIRMLVALNAAKPERASQIRTQISSVSPDGVPPQQLLEIPENIDQTVDSIDMKEASEVDLSNEAQTETQETGQNKAVNPSGGPAGN